MQENEIRTRIFNFCTAPDVNHHVTLSSCYDAEIEYIAEKKGWTQLCFHYLSQTFVFSGDIRHVFQIGDIVDVEYYFDPINKNLLYISMIRFANMKSKQA